MKLDRMIGILSALLQRNVVTAPQLARRFEVSRRTISRDIEALCCAGIPIVSRRGAEGGYSIMEGYRIDRTLLTRGELQAILAGLHSLDSVCNTGQYARLMEKLQPDAAQLLRADGCILIDLASWYRGPLSEKISALHAAIEASRAVYIRYASPTGESERWVEPYYLVYQWSAWYVYGWCRQREAWRLFKLNRVLSLQLGEVFSPRPVQPPELSAEQVFPERYHAVIAVDPACRWQLIETYGPACYTVMADGRLRYEGGFTHKGHLLDWVLSFRGGAELLEPVALRNELAQIGQALQRQYEAEPPSGPEPEAPPPAGGEA